jgi:hypothetical protein
MPFYRGDDSDVLPVFGHSYTFQDYLVQAYPLIKGNFSHYLIVGDDMLLNPALCEENILNALQCDSSRSYIKEIRTTSPNDPWAQRHRYLDVLDYPGISLAPLLPTPNELRECFERNALRAQAPKLRLRTYAKLGFWYFISHFTPNPITRRSRKLSHHKTALTSHVQYVVRSYSDFFAIASRDMDAFIHYCGVLSSIRLFAEIAIPTALIYAGATIRQEKDIAYHGVETWTKETNLTPAFTAAPGILDLWSYFSANPKALYVHPVKLSKFSTVL